MTHWQRIRRALGWTWRRPRECDHPESSQRWDEGCGFDPANDVECGDCGQLIGWFDAWGGWHDAVKREPYR